MFMLVGEWEGVCRGVQVRGPEDVGDALCRQFGSLAQEALFVLAIGSDRRVLSCSLAALGSANVARVCPKEVFRSALQAGAECLILVHNHPSGHTIPTAADLTFTGRAIRLGQLLGLEVLDHLIVADSSWRSLRDSTRLWCLPHRSEAGTGPT